MKRTVVSILGIVASVIFTTNAAAVIPPLIPVQGVLTNADGQVLNGAYVLTFAIYDAENGGTVQWTETKTGVLLDQGFFSVYLGDETLLPLEAMTKTDELWLSMTVGAEELSRVRLSSVPYALEAQKCHQTGNLQEADIQPVLSGDHACGKGQYLQGWEADAGVPICVDAPDTVMTEWTNAGITWEPPYDASSTIEYRKLGSMVFLRGVGNAAGVKVQDGHHICTLPEGVRPAKTIGILSLIRFPNESSGVAEVNIMSDGRVIVVNLVVNPEPKQFIYFDGVSFSTE